MAKGVVFLFVWHHKICAVLTAHAIFKPRVLRVRSIFVLNFIFRYIRGGCRWMCCVLCHPFEFFFERHTGIWTDMIFVTIVIRAVARENEGFWTTGYVMKNELKQGEGGDGDGAWTSMARIYTRTRSFSLVHLIIRNYSRTRIHYMNQFFLFFFFARQHRKSISFISSLLRYFFSLSLSLAFFCFVTDRTVDFMAVYNYFSDNIVQVSIAIKRYLRLSMKNIETAFTAKLILRFGNVERKTKIIDGL